MYLTYIQVPLQLYSDFVRYLRPVIAGSLSPAAIVCSVGIGLSASFEREIIENFGCQVYAFDPTPKSVAWIQAQNPCPDMHFAAIGIADADGTMTMAPPLNAAGISYSALLSNSDGRSSMLVPVRTLESAMQERGHSSIDLLKMDIESCEYRVGNLATGKIRPPQVLVEFHQGFYDCAKQQTLPSVAIMKRTGYDISRVSDRGLTTGSCTGRRAENDSC